MYKNIYARYILLDILPVFYTVFHYSSCVTAVRLISRSQLLRTVRADGDVRLNPPLAARALPVTSAAEESGDSRALWPLTDAPPAVREQRRARGAEPRGAFGNVLISSVYKRV